MNSLKEKATWHHVTLVVPTYNQSKLLDAFLHRFVSQAPPGLILHLVNDGSTDETEKVIEKYSEHPFLRVTNLSHQGAGQARNFGINQCVTEWIAFTDTDVILTTDFFSGLASLQSHSPEVAAVEGKVVAPSSHKPPLTHWLENIRGGAYATANFAARTKCLQSVKGFDSQFISNLREDTDLGIRLKNKFGLILFDPDRVVIHPFVDRDWLSSLMGAWKRQDQIIQTELLLFEKHPVEYKQVRRFSTALATLNWWSKWNLPYHLKTHWPWFANQIQVSPWKIPSSTSRYLGALILAGWEQIALFLQLHWTRRSIR